MRERAPRGAFLDRDGVLNIDRGFVHRPEDFVFVEGALEGCRQLQGLGYHLVVITNQSGIARGIFSEAEFAALTAWMTARMAEAGVTLAAVYHAPYHPEFSPPSDRHMAGDRKPAPGMIRKAQRRFGLDLAGSVLVGDRPTDIAAAHAAGIGRAFLVHPEPSAAASAAGPAERPTAVVRDLADAARRIAAEDMVADRPRQMPGGD